VNAPAASNPVRVPGRAGELERRYLSGTFAELCRIESPSGRERACAQRVIAELRALDVEVREDDAGPRAGSDCGNLLALVPGDASPLAGAADTAAGGRSEDRAAGADGAGRRILPERGSVLLCAHLDTVPLAAPVEPPIETVPVFMAPPLPTSTVPALPVS